MVVNGGLGKHLYNVTYNEMELKIPVSQCCLNDKSQDVLMSPRLALHALS